MSRIDFPKIYNPANQTPEELIRNFVVRTKLFQEIFNDIKNSKMKFPEQHYIIQGIRGQGKTTLLLRIAYEIENDAELRRRVIPVVFNEEQYNISSLYKLWETVAKYLEESNEPQGLYDEMQNLEDDEDYERCCFDVLENALKKKKKKIILFIDNIDEILQKLSDKEHKRLREVFTESAEIRVIGASSIGLEFHYDYGKPFYQFFKVPELKGLDAEETKILLLKLGEQYKMERVREIVENQPGRVEALRRITGGVIRTIVLLFDIFVDDVDGNAFSDLDRILDIVTPLYKHRMDKLSTQQQEIVNFIALNWDAVSVKEIVQETRLESKAVSSQLNQLEKYHIIEKEKTDTKNHLYRLYERFFNIWYLMRYGLKWDEKRVRFLAEFLQCWCDDLYSRELKDFKKARKYFLMALEKGDASAMISVARMHFEEKKEMDKALQYAEQSYKKKNNIFSCFTYSLILLWHNEIEKAYQVSKDFINDVKSIEIFPNEVRLFLIFLMAKKQYHLTLKIFNENPNNLKDRFKPIYYALMHFMKKEYPNEYRKMGGELKQTVDEIIKKVRQMEKDYA